ncbi:MAG: hypothetical protein K5925_06225 [Bacilli bacterium]|nr:hypothetical protein [Bacilli bacterium]
MGEAYKKYIEKEKLSRDFSREIANVVNRYFDSFLEKAKENVTPIDESRERAKAQYFKQAMIHEKNKEYEKALEFFLFAVELGHGEACYKAGIYYLNGLGTPINHDKAFTMFELGMRNYYFPANAKLAECYLYGYGTRIDVNKAIDVLEMGTFLDDEDCINLLADLYEKGEYIEKDYELADYLRSKIIPEGEA